MHLWAVCVNAVSRLCKHLPILWHHTVLNWLQSISFRCFSKPEQIASLFWLKFTEALMNCICQTDCVLKKMKITRRRQIATYIREQLEYIIIVIIIISWWNQTVYWFSEKLSMFVLQNKASCCSTSAKYFNEYLDATIKLTVCAVYSLLWQYTSR